MNILIEDFNNQNKDIIKNNVKSELKWTATLLASPISTFF